MGNFAENLNLGNRFRPPLKLWEIPEMCNLHADKQQFVSRIAENLMILEALVMLEVLSRNLRWSVSGVYKIKVRFDEYIKFTNYWTVSRLILAFLFLHVTIHDQYDQCCRILQSLYPDTGDQCSQLIVATLVPSTPICLFFNLAKLQCKQTVVTDFCIGQGLSTKSTSLIKV